MSFGRRLAPILTAFLIAMPMAGAANAQDTRFGPLTALSEGFLDPWDLAITGEGYRMRNDTDETSIRYVWSTSPDATLGTRTIGTDIILAAPDPSSSAGLLYGFEEEDDGTLFYYMFMVRPGNLVTLYRRDRDGVTVLSSTETAAVSPGYNSLVIEEDGDQVAFSINGETVALIGGIRGMGEGRIGIVAWGMGEYVFAGFTEDSPIETPEGGKGPAAGDAPPPAQKG
jgi:hypothetical protein